MKSFALLPVLAGIAAATTAPEIVIKGSKFFYSNNGTQFYIRGVAYQPNYDGVGTTTSAGEVDFVDPLANETICKRDLPYLTALNTNVVRVYDVDPDADHSTCMNLFAEAGIYVLADLSSADYSIDSSDPEWTTTLYSYYNSVVDSLANYTNTIGFFAGNENSNSVNTTGASAFVKAAVRDTKAYISSQGYRSSLGVGYSAADVSEIRDSLAEYFNCGDSADRIDFFGDNVYEWCGDSSYTESGYDEITAFFKNYSVPYFFSEYGCNTVQPRTFTNVPVMYGDEMNDWMSGGIVYEYFQDDNDYGLVTISDGAVSTLTDYASFSKEIVTATPTGTNSASYTPTNSAASCPTVGADWEAASALPPTPDAALCECMVASLSCVVKSSVKSAKYADLFDTVCGYGVCAGIDTNTTSGVYGAYSMCTSEQQLNFVLNEYYVEQKAAGNGASACDFSGSATTTASTSATGTCASLLSAVGTAGTGTVTAAAASGTGSSSSSSSTSSSAGLPRLASQSVNLGFGQLAVFIFTAVLSGTGMILL
ncbi:hypothetical protein ASPZODRAFT_25911 [Penicilliopsis zonata CBS 506.65]|uniref:1,3-beta-glucanosyltransferase n=1 Tax=Penicilliopsis zonata CBS 506.65 TaxID=1073090 RepID=A0A1L9SFG7_9EURO|nr:hypothetical protein ASPZODRAFT_25911 [Penicilliopsis zonata CBS 506.65]OJJ46015.1 hypothetical protein ASPZODRAFT_25911 [Penicilliopsis zonata CBS 506.65]